VEDDVRGVESRFYEIAISHVMYLAFKYSERATSYTDSAKSQRQPCKIELTIIHKQTSDSSGSGELQFVKKNIRGLINCSSRDILAIEGGL